ncbi:aldehyde dehydrogenase [Poseidonocella sp. HB161398]|uniref:aldehyde dehydrogenase n=1 Tax=Poseidonocella sp. HB161398 TaxID=2320855 RepID=UPI001107CBEB|nr:aldehyde dehydrogenase [Poseidonocella sp. HB161398]
MVWNAHDNALFVGGEWHLPSGGERISVVSPFTEEVIAGIAAAAPADVDRAVAAARCAFDTGPWPRMAMAERIAAVARLRAVMERRLEEVAQVITAEMGSPITASRTQQALLPIRMLDAFMEIARELPLRELRSSAEAHALVLRQPKGVVAAIVPWNAPLMSLTMKMGPALLAGCTMIIKTSPETALSGNLLGEMIAEAGFPDGVVSILPAGRETSEYLALHPGVDKVSFTGSTGAGRHLAARCGEMLRPITLELGGKSAALILDDADLPSVVASLRVGSLRNSGQVCSLKTRILVSARRRDEVVDALAAMIGTMPVGDPNDPATEIGPMATRVQMERVAGYIGKGLEEGARAVCGGRGRPEGLERGWFVRPTLFDGVTPDATIAQEEIFGPVLSVIGYANEEEAVAIANNSPYGLNGSVFTADPGRGLEIAARIKTGVVEINGSGVGFRAPIGGVKASGLGREAGAEGFDPFFELKSIGLPPESVAALAAE